MPAPHAPKAHAPRAHAPRAHAPRALHLEALHLEQVHTADGLLALATFSFGVLGLLLVGLDATAAGTWFGVAGVITGLWGQLVSRTTSERFLDVLGMGASALAFFVGALYGGL